MKNRLFVYIILISLLSIITYYFLHELNRYQKVINTGKFTFQRRIWLKRYIDEERCALTYLGWRLIIPSCNQLSTWGKVTISGSLTSRTDSYKKVQKTLIIQSITQENFTNNSGIRRSAIFLDEVLRNFRKYKLSTQAYLGEKQGSLVMGLLFGDKVKLGEELEEAFEVAGLQHVTSASGYNVNLVIILIDSLIGHLLPRKIQPFFLLSAVFLYSYICGFTASLVRATLMICLSITAKHLLHRQYLPLYGLLLTGSIMLTLNPWYLLDISFQLSVAATLGILLFSQSFLLFTEKVVNIFNFMPVSLRRFIGEVSAMTLSAQVFAWPLLWYHFQEVSLIALIANVALLWIPPLISTAGIVFMCVPPFMPGGREILRILLWVLCEVFFQGVLFFGHFKFTQVRLAMEFSTGGVLIWWIVAIWCSWWLKNFLSFKKQTHTYLILGEGNVV